ncbi:unnamed protein product [Phaeothamnion confervicola]
MQYAYHLRPARAAMLAGALTDREAGAVAEHFEYVQQLRARGVVQMAGRTFAANGDVFAVVFFTAESDDAARVIMLRDPAVRAGVMVGELFPFRGSPDSFGGAAGDAPGV